LEQAKTFPVDEREDTSSPAPHLGAAEMGDAMKKMINAAAATAAALMAIMTASSASAQTTTSTQGSGFVIADLSTNSSIVAITDPITVSNVTFSLNGLQHTWIGDLVGTLSHNGITVNWLNRTGSSADLNGNYLISDLGTTTLGGAAGSPRPSGTYLANDSLSAFDGMSALGDWTLTISDQARLDTGNLDNWTLNLTGTPAVPEPATWAMMILGMGAVGYSLRRAKRKSDVKFDAKIKRITAGAIA